MIEIEKLALIITLCIQLLYYNNHNRIINAISNTYYYTIERREKNKCRREIYAPNHLCQSPFQWWLCNISLWFINYVIIIKHIFNNQSYLASKARANTPAASGAAAEVPEWLAVQLLYRSVVAWGQMDAGMVGLTPKWIRLAPNRSNQGLFKYILAQW